MGYGRRGGSDQVAHVWAQQTKERGRAGNFYFEGDTIYSYGHHFPIARFVEHKGKRCVLFTTKTYSNTTSGHIGAVRGALNGLDVPVFHVEDPCATPGQAQKMEFQSRSDSHFEKALKARGRAIWHASIARDVVTEANKFSEFFGLRWRLKVPELSEAAKEKHREAAKRAAATVLRNEKQRQKLVIEACLEWQAGGVPSAPPYTRYLSTDPTFLRIKDGNVETSRGAQVPIEHAKRLWPVILRQKAKGEVYQRNGHTIHVGEFTIDRIEPTGDIVAGCHKIAFDQILKIAQQLGLTEETV